MKLELGYHHGFEVRKEQHVTNTSEGFSVLYLSDFHFNSYGKFLTEEVISIIAELNPTIILFGGDYVDTGKGLNFLHMLAEAIDSRSNVFAIAGNHDYFFGLQKIKAVFLDHHIHWIEKRSVRFQWKNITINIDGNIAKTEKNSADFSILCLHKPIDIKPYADHYNVAFAGHLHGCQCVFWDTPKGMYPGRWFYKWNRLGDTIDNCRYLISRGLGDTLPVRYNCKKEVIFIEVISHTDIFSSHF